MNPTRRRVLHAVMVLGVVGAIVVAGQWNQSRQARRAEEAKQALVEHTRPVPVSVVEIVDGDTLVVETPDGTESVELLGLVAPGGSDCVSDFARAGLERLFDDGPVTLVASSNRDRDNDGSLERYVFAGETFVNEAVIRGGYADYSDDPGHDREDELYETWVSNLDSNIDAREEACPTTTTSPSPAPPNRPTNVVVPKYQANQYGCHSDGRCLDQNDQWCDQQDFGYPDGYDYAVCFPWDYD